MWQLYHPIDQTYTSFIDIDLVVFHLARLIFGRKLFEDWRNHFTWATPAI
jgi:hypothetical protein